MQDELLIVPGVGGRQPNEVSRKQLAGFLEPRIEEILSLVKTELAQAGFLGKVPSGVVMTGGSSALDGMPELAAEIFELPTRLGLPIGVGGLVDRVQGPEFATGVGLAAWGAQHSERPAFRIADRAPFRKIRARMREWFYGESC